MSDQASQSDLIDKAQAFLRRYDAIARDLWRGTIAPGDIVYDALVVQARAVLDVVDAQHLEGTEWDVMRRTITSAEDAVHQGVPRIAEMWLALFVSTLRQRVAPSQVGVGLPSRDAGSREARVKPEAPPTDLERWIYRFNQGCRALEVAAEAEKDGDQMRCEWHLGQAVTATVSAFELLLKLILRRREDYIPPYERPKLQRANFPKLTDLLTRYVPPPLEPEVRESLRRFKDMRNQYEHEGTIPPGHELHPALQLVRTVVLRYVPDVSPESLGPFRLVTTTCGGFQLGELIRPRPPYIVTCVYDDFYDGYHLFLHEADMMLVSLGNAVSAGAMTAEDARKYWWPYATFYSELYEPGYEEEWAEGFPIVGDDMDFLPGSDKFWDEAATMEIPGVGFLHPLLESPASGRIFRVAGFDALTEVRKQLSADYRIVLRDEETPGAVEWWHDPKMTASRLESVRNGADHF